ncbi:MAG: RNA-directed DNA polymerase, partial [Algoriphagus sp.]|nr:RNA-directed DNA polymerase [Algoriphagus sp.]
MNQSYQRQQLIRLCKKAEYLDYGMSIKQLTDSLDKSYEEIAKDSFEFSLKQVSEYFLTNNLPNKLILRKLNDNIKRIYKDEQANRRIIISQVKTLLSETCPFWVIKTDIKSFYESIDRERLISKFHDDSMLSYQSMFLIKRIFENPLLAGKSGVPRGMNISATMSELYMRKFDRWVRSYDSVYYYARFVDDIIIFSNSLKDSLSLIENLNVKLELLAEGLSINHKKTVDNPEHIDPLIP